MTNDVSIIGYGRFGKVLEILLAKKFNVKIDDVSCSTIFIAVPIRAFEKTIRDIADKINPEATIIDVCSVKIYPVKIMKQYLPQSVSIIATHPLFGPDSIQNNHPLKIMMNNVRDHHNQYQQWKDFFTQHHIEVLEMTPEQHDELAAKTQGITHFVGRILEKMNAKASEIDTSGYAALLKVMQQTCNDSRELFLDLQRYNPYPQKMIGELEAAIAALKHEISE
ncbi:prephenate dehydrogenase/arogenate dehydrogenase family protein [Candidiatus Paracoxiella cheracis]|uniref:prephenate dehydrogenase/arogenate dehydrogenase family protein n=1 Tax=Candidiatus Paracoxiella cheracis TaxID=3405120 RepID=UPI003BF5F624